MIYTVTFNPSLDYIVSVPGFELGKTNRTESEQLLPGGKGINVSILLNHIGIESTGHPYRFYSDGKWMCAYQFEASECRRN